MIDEDDFPRKSLSGLFAPAPAPPAILTSSRETHRAGEKILSSELRPKIFRGLVLSKLGLKLDLLHLLVLQK